MASKYKAPKQAPAPQMIPFKAEGLKVEIDQADQVLLNIYGQIYRLQEQARLLETQRGTAATIFASHVEPAKPPKQ